MSKKCGEGFDGVGILELHGERMLDQYHARRLLVCMQGRLETGPEASGCWVVTHIASREKRWTERRELPVVGCGRMVVRRWDVVGRGLGIVSESDRSDIGECQCR